MDQKVFTEEFHYLGETSDKLQASCTTNSKCEIKTEDVEFDSEDLHHSIDIKEESSTLKSQVDVQMHQQFECNVVMASTARRKRNYIAIIPEQKDMMVKYLAANPALSSGKFSSNFTCKIAQNHWQKLALQLNSSMRGPKKNWKEWRKTWQDMKSRVKSKNSKIRLCTDKTGGGSPPPLVVLQDKLTLLKEQMSGELIPKVSITRLTGISEKPSDATTSVTTVPELIPFSEKKHPPAEEPKKNVNRSSQGQRATDVAVTTTKQVTSKEDYYTRKLVLLERLAAAEERKAAAEERKADLLSTLLEKNFPLFR